MAAVEYEARVAWTFSNGESLQKSFTISFVEPEPIEVVIEEIVEAEIVEPSCIEASILFEDTSSFQSEYTVYAGDYLASSSSTSVSSDSALESSGTAEDASVALESSESISAIDQEDEIVIQWPALAINIPIGCQVEPLTEVTLLGDGALG